MSVYHMSDPHWTFDENGAVMKPMTLRKWTKGSPNYEGYLDKMIDFSKTNITDADIVVITGDLTHDLNTEQALHSFRWVEKNINGIKIFIRGNHDQSIDFAHVRILFEGHRMFFIDEGELLTIGRYTFGCYSDHEGKTGELEVKIDRKDYYDMARAIIAQAKNKKTIPVMLSHYPVPKDVAEHLGEMGIKAYLSGHIHCTCNTAEDPSGTNWHWYNLEAKPTDDKIHKGCYFSTGNTDVLLVKTGKIMKKIECLEVVSITETGSGLVGLAANAFMCSPKFVNRFEKQDPFNTKNKVSGFICRLKGEMGGSLLITHVNGMSVSPQLIWGVPKLAYPYKSNSTTEYLNFEGHESFMLAEKYNGMNILFFKYYDAQGTLYVSAKSKGTPFVSDSEVGNYLTLTKIALGIQPNVSLGDHLQTTYSNMYLWDENGQTDPNLQSVSCELMGRKEPHLVKYDVDLLLAPLFTTTVSGRIRPIGCDILSGRSATYSKDDSVDAICKMSQDIDLETNQAYRQANGLQHKYEYEHFAVEGKVLYLLDKDGYLIDRTMYKIKPKDVEEVHWQVFDSTMQAKVQAAVKKIKLNEEAITEKSIREELDMGPKEWDKFGENIMTYVAVKADDKREVLILVGLPGSGKSTFATDLEQYNWTRISQDELKSRNACKKKMDEALSAGKRVVIDRCNFDVKQRQSWIDLARTHNVTKIRALVFNIPAEVCKNRIVTRQNHPTIAPVEGSKAIIDNFLKMLTFPTSDEGFVTIDTITDNAELEKLRHQYGISENSESEAS